MDHKKRSRSPKKEKKDKKQKSKKSKERKSEKKKKKSEKKAQEQHLPVETKEQRIQRLKEERRRRSRSNSAIRHYQKQIMNNNPAAKASSLGYDKQDCFWDGFTWVPKTNLHDKVRDDKDKVMSLTSKMRRIQICNIPTGLTNRDLYAELSRFMNRNFLNDMNNPKPILYCHLNEKDRTCTIELSSAEEATRMLNLYEIKLLDESCKVLRLGESPYGRYHYYAQANRSTNLKEFNKLISRPKHKLLHFKLSKPSDSLRGRELKTRFWLRQVGNFLNAAMAINLNRNEWNEMREDLLEGFSQFGAIEDDFFVKPYQAGLGAEAGSLFIIYTTKEEAQKTVIGMYGRTYNQRPLKVIFINEGTYLRSYVPLKLKQPPEGEEFQYPNRDEYDENSFEDEEAYLFQDDDHEKGHHHEHEKTIEQEQPVPSAPQGETQGNQQRVKEPQDQSKEKEQGHDSQQDQQSQVELEKKQQEMVDEEQAKEPKEEEGLAQNQNADSGEQEVRQGAQSEEGRMNSLDMESPGRENGKQMQELERERERDEEDQQNKLMLEQLKSRIIKKSEED